MHDILSSLLAQKSGKRTEFERIFWFVSLMKWIQRPRSADEKNQKRETVYTVRLKYILLMLSRNPEWKQHFIETIEQLMFQVSSANQFSKIGYSQSSFMQEFVSRLQEKLLPKAPLNRDLENLINEIFPSEEEAIFVDCIEVDVLDELMALFAGRTELEKRLKHDILTASYMLSVQMLNSLFYIRDELKFADRTVSEMPEFKLQNWLEDHLLRSDYELDGDVFYFLSEVEKNILQLEGSMPAQGVKIDLVHSFQTQKRRLRRLTSLVRFLNPHVSSSRNLRHFVSQLILETSHKKSLISFFSENFALLTERIVQANSHIGEHYVTYTWEQFRKMMVSAAGGGAITAMTVYLKILIGKLGFAGFIKGLSESINYAGSFLLISFLGLTLATKQPSATAPFIASALQKSTREARRSLVALLRTQFVAVLGNMMSVFPIAFLVSFLFFYFDRPVFQLNQAIENFSSSNLVGPSLFFAAFTGCLLFSGSIIAGWAENWIIVNQVAKRIRYHSQLRLIFGVKTCERAADFVSSKANILASNIGLGFLLGLTPQFMKFMGLSIEVRHVTLATGNFAASLPQLLNMGVDVWSILNAVTGLFVIGLVNVSVSFVLAFLLASTSSKVKFRSFVKLFRSSLRLLLSRPWLLFVPEKNK